MVWWGWLVIGFGLMIVELMGVEAAFYLVIIGFAAILTGLVGLVGLTLPIWGQWVLFAGLAIFSMLFFRQSLYIRLRGQTPKSGNPLVGETVSLSENVAPGARCRVELRGSTWTARNVGSESLSAGGQAEVIAVDNTLLEIEASADA